jgi:hypothetical protein
MYKLIAHIRCGPYLKSNNVAVIKRSFPLFSFPSTRRSSSTVVPKHDFNCKFLTPHVSLGQIQIRYYNFSTSVKHKTEEKRKSSEQQNSEPQESKFSRGINLLYYLTLYCIGGFAVFLIVDRYVKFPGV